ncbi:MAG TPA: STAS domain-containing protein [Gemmataceae bacterium]|jgi:anti-anti-sigma factor|nr:STAS domain-containing protein [Gemmataceae bacterium]
MSQPQHPHVRAGTEQGVLVLTFLDKELRDEPQCAMIRQEFHDALTRSGDRKIVVDFRNVQFVSSVAFRPLLSLRRLVHDTGARLVLCNLSEMVADVFQATRLLASTQAAAAPFEAKTDLPSAIAYLNK